MKLDATRWAHALAITTASLYVVCWLLVGTSPMFYRGMMQSWMHGVDIRSLPFTPLTMNLGLYGLVTMTAVAWITGYAFAWIYNSLGKK